MYYITDFIGCPFGTDPEWKIQWGNTPINQTDRQPCPGGVETFGMYYSGNAVSYCIIVRFCNTYLSTKWYLGYS